MERSKSVRSVQSQASKQPFCYRPSPYDFIEFVPWACKQYEVDVAVRTIVNETKASSTRRTKVSHDKKSKGQSIKSVVLKDEKISSSSSFNFLEEFTPDQGKIEITATFDYAHSLLGIKMNNNTEVPRKIFLVIALIIDLYPLLTSFSANRGLDAYCIYEITKLLEMSSITEICLDGTCLKNPNYYILLETESNLNCLSLAKCQINDEMIQKIAVNLALSGPSSRTLTFLNISSNRITDTGVAYLAEALKTNRHLAYLNLADNRITDTGASHIFDTMLEFPISSEELEQSKIRRKKYIEKKNKMFHKYVGELKNTEETKSVKRKVNGKSLVGRRKSGKKAEEWPLDKLASLKSLAEVKQLTSLDVKFFDRAENLASQAVGPFEDPFENSFVKDDLTYCKGNNTLTCLNLAYNNLSFNSLQKLIEVLKYQMNNQQTPRGLFRVRLEGNYLPSNCEEYTEINGLLDLAVEAANKKQFKGWRKSIYKK